MFIIIHYSVQDIYIVYLNFHKEQPGTARAVFRSDEGMCTPSNQIKNISM